MTVRRRSRSKFVLIISATICVVCSAISLGLLLSKRASGTTLRQTAEMQSPASQSLIGFEPISGTAGSLPPCGSPKRFSPIPDTSTAGDVLLVSLVFDCNSTPDKSYSNDDLELVPALYAPGFDVAPVATTPFVDRDFYCITALDDPLCAGDSVTKPANLAWTWSLRSQSSGHDIIVFVVNAHRIGTPNSEFVGAPRSIYVSSMDVHDPVSSEISDASTLFAAISGLATVAALAYRIGRRWFPGLFPGGAAAAGADAADAASAAG
jgi:hypothetical protein